MEDTFANNTKSQFFKYLENSILDIDGGNIRAKLWFCGIEPGMSENYSENYLKDLLKKQTVYTVDDFRNEQFHVPYYTDNISKFHSTKRLSK
ncbi:MAG: hypothetical protein IPM69_13070 [Ignavibacteria bacterium]|nr:hypothetical protein [Ignavibacteria bacterium]